jgi:hypothetical protein
MSYGGIKVYHLIFLDFKENEYKVYQYEKDRRYTAHQAWDTIHSSAPIKTGKLSPQANIDTFYDIVRENSLDEKRCDRYVKFSI